MKRDAALTRGRPAGRAGVSVLLACRARCRPDRYGLCGSSGPGTELNTSVSGTVSIGSGVACGGIVEATTDASLSGSPALGNATIHVEICVTSVVPNDQFFGTFVIDSLLGTITGTAVISSPDPPGANPQRITGTLTPTGGTGPLRHVDGPITVNLMSFGTYPAPVTGTLSAPVRCTSARTLVTGRRLVASRLTVDHHVRLLSQLRRAYPRRGATHADREGYAAALEPRFEHDRLSALAPCDYQFCGTLVCAVGRKPTEENDEGQS